jgi:hypothetical protein
MANLCVFSDKIAFCMDKNVKNRRFSSLIYKKFNHFGSNFSDFGKTVLQKNGAFDLRFGTVLKNNFAKLNGCYR